PRGIAASAWLVVVALLALRLVVGFAFVSFLRHTAAPLRAGPIRELVSRTATEMGLRRHVRVAASVTVHAPVLAGVLRPAILLPRQLIDSFSLEQLRYVIAHELAHVRRLDNGVLLVQRMAELLLFFHPVVWVCGWAMRREAEAACDDAVVAACGSPAQYADSLTRVAETTRSVRSLITRRLLVNTFAAAESNFAGRVRRILRGRAGRMGIGLTVASVIALVLIACFGLPTAAEPEEETLSGSGGKETKEESVRGKQDSLRYGFRRDPMEWVGSDESLQAAMVRTFVFERPADGDAELLNARVEQILAGQAEDGRIGEKTVCAALELFRLGCPPGDPRLRRAVDWIALNATDEDGTLPTYALRAVCLSGQGHAELRDASLRKLAQQCERGMHAGCPWTPSVSLETLWAGRAFVDVEAALASELRWMAQGMNQAGFLSYKDPWGLLNVAGTVDHPLGREIVVKLLPMILRTQLHDGSWGGGSEVPEAPGGTFMVLRALVKYGLLDKLRDLPPLPADWRVVRSIPAPPVPEAGEPDWEFYRTMTFGRGLLWVYVPKIHSAIAVSPEDGQVVRTVKLPGEATYGIGWYRDSLAILTGPEDVGPLALVDPESGEVQREIAVDPDLARVCTVPAEVNGRLWCADGWFWIVHTVDPERPWQLQHICLAAPTGGWGTDMAFDGAGLWHFDRGEALLVRSDVRAEPLRWEGEPAEGLPFGAAHDGEPIGGFHSARLLDFAEKPFGNLGGVAWDGNHLWALDVDGRAICMIERAPGGSATAPMSHGSRAKLPSTTPGPRHGFRHDPMRFVEEGGTLEAALARKLVFGRRRAGDDEIISARLAEVLSEQRPDGSLGPTAKETGNGLYRLAALGLKADTAQVRRAFEAMIRQVRAGQIGGEGYEPEHRLVPVNGLRGACMAGCTDSPEVRRTLRWLADNPDIWTRQTCPWGATFVLRALWHGRDVEEVDAGLAAGLRIVAGNLNDAGCVKYWDPYAVVAAVGVIEWPEARSILLRQLPMVLRGQQGDGSWGDNPEDLPTLGVLRALKIHNLLDELRELPALPPDWEVVRSIPAPEGKLGTMAWLDGRLWVLDWEAGQIMALSPEDGGVARALPFPEGGAAGVGRWGDSLAVTQGKPHKRLLKVSPESGAAEREVPLSFMEMIMSATEVDGRLWVADGWLFPGNVVDPDDPSTYSGADAYELPRLEPHLAGTCPNGFAVAPDGVWHTDYFARVMIKSAPDGTLMDWAERPFGWTSGIAYDGRQLWAIDNANGRICAIEKTLTAPRVRSETALDRPAGEVKISPDREKLLDLAEHDHHPRDSFSLTMQAAARAFGKDVDYERLYALSTNAFAPDLRPDEQCRITWRMRGRGQCLDLVADALGLRVRPLHG
ncbi:MAG: M56 family metallopeptidase, partial [Candidatus Brocadiaceae bacterium]